MIDFSDEQLEHYLTEDPGGPVVMLNLLRFKPDGGRERYFEYVEALAPVGPKYGLELLYVGAGDTALAAEPGQEWDAVALVRYPSRQAFAEMVRSPDYQAVAHLRTEGLIEATLQPTVAIG
jgi:uncharacterized protein (DUF1330 family)